MKGQVMIGAAIALLAVSGVAFAHHGWGSYDAGTVMTVENAVTALEWQNPHVHLAVNHSGESWDVVLAPPFRMESRGLDPAMIKVGTRIRVVGYPSTKVPREMRAERILVHGKTFELR